MQKLTHWLVVVFFVVFTVPAVSAEKSVAIVTPGLALAHQAQFIGPLDSNKTIHFVVWLTLRNMDQLNQVVEEIYDPRNSHHSHFLTPKAFNAHYAPSKQVIHAVEKYFQARGMQAKSVGDSVRVSATVAQIEQVFQIKMNQYQYQNRTVYATASAPTVTAEIAQYVSEISGLNNMVQFKPMFEQLRSQSKPHQVGTVRQEPTVLTMLWDYFVPAALPTDISITAGFTGAQLQTTYQLAAIPPINGTAIDGAGQTLVIIDACGNNSAAQIQADANAYNAANGLPALNAGNFTVINPNGTPFSAGCGVTGWEDEIALDVESSHTIAPGANIVLVLAPNSGYLEIAVADVIRTLVNQNYTIAGFSSAYVISNSWGAGESTGEYPSMETNLEIAAAFGLSFNYASGDCGNNIAASHTTTCVGGTLPTVNYPASSAYVTAVGGSSVFVDNAYSYAFETGWGAYQGSNFLFGAGGGISQLYGPVDWQSSISGFDAGGYANGTVGYYNKRAIPDVAMLADPVTGLTIYVTDPSHCDTGICTVDHFGGTSLATPLFSATLTLVNQARALTQGVASPIGLTAPFLYTYNQLLVTHKALNVIIPPHQIISGAIEATQAGAPLSAFTVDGYTFGFDSAPPYTLTVIENQFWNDVVGVGSPNIPNFITIALM